MENVVKGAYFCQQNRTTELSNRIYERNVPTTPLQMNYDPRPVDTKFVQFPIMDCRLPSNVPCEKRPIYNTGNMFSGSSQGLPFNGYQSSVDTESSLMNIVFPLQSCPQATFIPGSKSDLYNTSYLTPPVEKIQMTNKLLFKQERFSPFNPNVGNLGGDLFNNNTRVQIKNMNTN
uniref:Uncharacterized protein n=1 Tax=viral metagenome TaxID=1070528 RepID=A0A6C0C5U8_9ZZZZ